MSVKSLCLDALVERVRDLEADKAQMHEVFRDICEIIGTPYMGPQGLAGRVRERLAEEREAIAREIEDFRIGYEVEMCGGEVIDRVVASVRNGRDPDLDRFVEIDPPSPPPHRNP